MPDIIWLVIIHYKEIILASAVWIREALFAIWWWVGIIYRWVLWILDYPFAVGMGSIMFYSLIMRGVWTFLYRRAGILNIGKALYFLPVSLLWWYFGSIFILESSNIYLYIIIWVFLLLSGFLHFFPFSFSWPLVWTIRDKRIKYIIWYIIMIIADLLTTVVWWAGIIYTYIFKYFFNIWALESAAMRKVFMIGRSIMACIVYYQAGTYSITLFSLLLLIGIPLFITGTNLLIKKWNNFAEHLLGYLSIGFGLFMLYKWLMF